MLAASALSVLGIVAPLAPGQQAAMLDPIIRSVGFSPIASDAYGCAFTVLDRSRIESRGIATVQDALRALSGVSVSSSGPSLTQVRIRGGEASHTLILIDGIEAQGGGDEYVLSGLQTDDIDRI